MDHEEKVLLGLVAAAAGYVLYRTQYGDFTYWEALLPRAAAVSTLVLVVVVLVVHYLRLSGDGEGLTDRLEVDESEDDGDPFGFGQSMRQYTVPGLGTELPFRLAVGLLVAVYTILAVLLGLGPSSIIFLLLYTQMADMERNPTIGLIAATLVVLFVFSSYLETPLMDGWIPNTFLFAGGLA